MTVKEFIGTLESSDRLRIIEGKAEVYVGYLAAFKPFADHEISEEYRKYSGHEVKKLELLGRYQSRQYEKVLDATTGEREQRTAYEVSVRLIRRKEEARNESKSRNE